MDTLGKALRHRRGSLSQRAAARELGVAVQTYIWWERGAVTPRLSKVAALAQWLDIPEDEVLRKLHDSEIQALRDREQDRPAVTIPEEKGAYLSAATFGPVLAQVA